LSGQPNFWQDQLKAAAIGRRLEALETEVTEWTQLLHETRQLEEYIALAQNEQDTSIGEEAEKQFSALKDRFEKLEFTVMFSGPYDERNAILSIHAGTGGVDAQDWAQMLERMFLRFAERHAWKTEIIDRVVANEAGIKSVSIEIDGHFAYGYLKSEAGSHRLVRMSPFNADGKRQTSFALVEVIPELPEDDTIVIKDDELQIDFFRSSGPGGQNVNKTSSAVRLTHLPTGIVVACQSERSQHQNRELAMKMLRGKLADLKQSDRADLAASIKGKHTAAGFGNRIRSYVLQPNQLVKDERTGYETADVYGVLDGNIDEFVEAYLRLKK
jgi:peptide chain release factor 2